jgi:chitodextrinase
VTGYAVYRNDVQVATTTATSYTDRTVEPNTTYSYHVKAYDAAGNLSPPSNPVTLTTGAGNLVLTFTPSDDATVKFDAPDATYASAKNLEVDASPQKRFFVKFPVSGTSGCRVVQARLELLNVDASGEGGAVHRVSNTSWTEGTLTWNNKPAADATPLGILPAVVFGTTYTVDVTSIATGDGVVGLAVLPRSTNGADYSSKEGSQAPRLIVECTSGS